MWIVPNDNLMVDLDNIVYVKLSDRYVYFYVKYSGEYTAATFETPKDAKNYFNIVKEKLLLLNNNITL
jgi:regulator of protease activity HflC (stomatin/prohibitin superfamily)